MHTNVFAKNLPIAYFKKSTLQTCINVKRTRMPIFEQDRVSRSVKTVHTNLFAKKNENCINLQLAIRILENHAFWTCTTPIFSKWTIWADFEINLPIRYQITAKRKYFHRRQTDRWTDRQTDRWTDRRTDRQTDRQTTDRQTDDGQTDKRRVRQQ